MYIDETQEALQKNIKETCMCSDKVDILTNIVQRQGEKIQIMNDKQTRLESIAMRAELIIFGLQDDKTACAQIATKFFKEKSKNRKSSEAKYAYWKGKSKFKPMVVRLSNSTDKGIIYANFSKLKDVTNENSRSYRIQDHLPEELAEIQRRNQQIVAQNKKLSDAEQQPLSIKKGKLMLNNQEIKNKFSIPNVKEILDLSEGNINHTLPMAKSRTTMEAGNKFFVYAAEVASRSEVRKHYTHVMRKYPDASHIVEAYRLAGLDKVQDEGCEDNGEHRMGRRILDQLIQAQVRNVCIFTIRYYSGNHIGFLRFTIVKDLVVEVLEKVKNKNFNQSKLPLRCIIDQKPVC